MGLTNTHILYHKEAKKVLLFVPNGNPDKARAIERTNEFLHTLVNFCVDNENIVEFSINEKKYALVLHEQTEETEVPCEDGVPESETSTVEVVDGN